MSAASVFEFRFKAEDAMEGVDLATRIGNDMPATEGYLRHDVIHDAGDPAHVMVITFWQEQTQGERVLSGYVNDAKVSRATELLGVPPAGFLGWTD